MRYLMRMGYDNECFAAAVLSLAVKGYLRIQQDAGILGFGKTFTLIKTSLRTPNRCRPTSSSCCKPVRRAATRWCSSRKITSG